MPVPLSTKSYDHYAGANNLSVYPITFPTYESSTVKAYITNKPNWSHIENELQDWAYLPDLADLKKFDLVLGTDFSLQNINKPNTALTLLDASAVPSGWVGPIPARQEWLQADGTLSIGYYLFVEFIPNPMRPSVLSSGNQLIPALSKDLDRLTMHTKAIDHKLDEVVTAIDIKLTDGFEFLDDKIDVGLATLSQRIDDIQLEAGMTDVPYQGFSLRYGEAIDFENDREALLYILQLGYLAAGISLSCSPSPSVREKGDTVTSVTMNATTTKNTDPITAVTHFRNGVLVDTEAAPAAGGGLESFVESTPFADNVSFYSKVFDGTTLVQSNTVTYPFVYPYYEGKGAAALNAAGIVASLTKVVRASTASVSVTTSPTGEHFYFCYPAAYPALTSILDPNGFETISAYTARTVSITGLDGTAQSYRVYELTLPTTQVAFTNTFKR